MKQKKNGETRISEAEWRLMEALWQLGEARPAQIIEALEGEADWNHRTIRTLLARLQKKGAVRTIETGVRNHYAAALTREDCLRVERRWFARRFFGGDVKALMTHFVESEPLGTSEIEELRALLDAAEDSNRRSPNKKSK